MGNYDIFAFILGNYCVASYKRRTSVAKVEQVDSFRMFFALRKKSVFLNFLKKSAFDIRPLYFIDKNVKISPIKNLIHVTRAYFVRFKYN